MKNYILVACAVASLYLSFTFQYEKEESPATRQQEETLPEESLLWTDQQDLVSAESLIRETVALQYEPAPVATAAKATKKAKAKKGFKRLKSPRRFQADSLKLAFMDNEELQRAAAQWLGTPYRAGNNTRRGTDCSGFVQKIYKQVYGINLSRSSRSMYNDVQPIAQDELREGDLVFFKRKTGPIYHVGIYLKDGKFIHSASNGGVMVSSLNQKYYSRNFYAAGRVNNVN